MFLLRIARRVKPFFVWVGDVQARLILAVLYAALFPVGFIVRFASDPLRRRPPAGGNWGPRPESPPSLDAARRQY